MHSRLRAFGRFPSAPASFILLLLNLNPNLNLFSLLRRWTALSLCLLAACSVSEPKADLVFINGPDPETLDPPLATGVEDLRVVPGLFEGLARYDPVTG